MASTFPALPSCFFLTVTTLNLTKKKTFSEMYLFSFLCVSVLPAYMYTYHMRAGACGSQKRGFGSPELQMVVSLRVGARSRT